MLQVDSKMQEKAVSWGCDPEMARIMLLVGFKPGEIKLEKKKHRAWYSSHGPDCANVIFTCNKKEDLGKQLPGNFDPKTRIRVAHIKTDAGKTKIEEFMKVRDRRNDNRSDSIDCLEFLSLIIKDYSDVYDRQICNNPHLEFPELNEESAKLLIERKKEIRLLAEIISADYLGKSPRDVSRLFAAHHCVSGTFETVKFPSQEILRKIFKGKEIPKNAFYWKIHSSSFPVKILFLNDDDFSILPRPENKVRTLCLKEVGDNVDLAGPKVITFEEAKQQLLDAEDKVQNIKSFLGMK